MGQVREAEVIPTPLYMAGIWRQDFALSSLAGWHGGAVGLDGSLKIEMAVLVMYSSYSAQLARQNSGGVTCR
jgi:hypothetical protein